MTGAVTIALTEASYASGKPVVAIVQNGLDHPIYADDLQSDCTVITLEQQTGDEWKPLSACLMKRMSRPVAIAAGETQVVQIDPLSSNFGLGLKSPAFGAGRYRLSFSYRSRSREGTGAPTRTVYSRTFRIT
jgi:hypothetical protein